MDKDLLPVTVQFTYNVIAVDMCLCYTAQNIYVLGVYKYAV